MRPARDAFFVWEIMIHEIFPVGPLQCNCSVIGDEQSREAMVIDPGDEIERVLEAVRKHGLKVTLIVVTHAHIDHIGGAEKFNTGTGPPAVMDPNALTAHRSLMA